MSTFFATLLILHVTLGFVGVIASYATTLKLLKREISKCSLTVAAWTAFVAYMLSWLSGGWYYWKYYGTAVKPAIVGGAYPWAHLVFMEAKEHVFLFLPFATLVLALLLQKHYDSIAADSTLQRKVAYLALTITVLATIVTLSGILITGGAR